MMDQKRAERAVRFIELLKHTKGQWAGRKFQLLDWQRDQVVKPIFGNVDENGNRIIRKAYVEIPKKNGKALACDTPIPTPSGWKTMGELRSGDMVFAETGKPCRVLAVSKVMTGRPCYVVRFSDGSEIVADAEHQWETETYRPWMKRGLHTTEEIRTSLDYQLGKNHKIGLAGPLKIETVGDLPVHPYVLGAWLGDGASATASLTCDYGDHEIIAEIERCGVQTYEWKSSNTNSGHYHLGKRDRTQAARNLCIQSKLREMNLLHNKHIPAMYLWAGIEDRLSLLQGLMDTDGTISKAGQCELTTTRSELAEDAAQLIVSLGLKVSVSQKRAMLRGKDCGPKYRLFFWPNGLPVFRLHRKLIRQKEVAKKTRAYYRKIVSVDPVGSVPVRCIQVENPSGLFLAGRSMVPTHNSELAAAIALYLLYADNEYGAEIYSAACDREQASIVFNVAANMVRQDPVLSKKLKVLDSTKRILYREKNSYYHVLSADSYTKHGYNTHGVIFDELHAQPNRDLWDVLTEGAGDARTQPLIFAITTAGYDKHSVCYEVHEYAEKVAKGVIKDEHFLPVLYGLPDDEDWTKEENWYKVNPSLDKTITIDKLRDAFKEAQEIPAKQNLFRRLRLNQWTSQETRWLDLKFWDHCPNIKNLDRLKGRRCYGGLDLASSIDIAAFVLVFPDEMGFFDVLPFFWVPEERVQERVHTDKVPYDAWVRDGHMTATEGNVIHYDRIETDIEELGKMYNISEIAFDRWGAVQISQHLDGMGFKVIPFGQGFKDMSPPTKEFQKLIMSRKIRHTANPVMRWMFDNIAIRTDPAENVKMDKGKSTERIDGMVATVMGLGRAILNAGESVYDGRGVITI